MTTRLKSRFSHLAAVVDLGFGSSGKGQVAAAFVRDQIEAHNYLGGIFAVRQGSVQAAHTVRAANGELLFTQLLPCPVYSNPKEVAPILGASCLVSAEVIALEMKKLHDVCDAIGCKMPMIFVDSQAPVLTSEHEHQEASSDIRERIGSCAEGVGAGQSDRIMRTAYTASDPRFERDLYLATGKYGVSQHKNNVRIVDTVELCQNLAGTDALVLVEGTQGVLLNLDTSGFYPFTTSRNVDPQSLFSQTGVHPRFFDRVTTIGTQRTFPIRVGGNSGPMPGETSWEELQNTYGHHIEVEKATLTRRVRRIAELDEELVRRAHQIAGVDMVALTFLDYPCPHSADYRVGANHLPLSAWRWVDKYEKMSGCPVGYVSTGQGQEHTFKVPERVHSRCHY